MASAEELGAELGLDRAGETPLHRQIFEGMRDAVLSGRVGAGERLPSSRALAAALGVGRNTAIAAFEQLAAEGYVVARAGAGTRVCDLPLASPHRGHVARSPTLSRRGRALCEPRDAGPDLGRVAFQPGLPDVSTFPYETWSRLLAREQRRARATQVGYDSDGGHPELRAGIARRLALVRGVHCEPAQVVIVAGAQAALDLVARVTLDPGDEAWIEEPGYLGARHALVAAGARLRPVPVDAEGLDVAAGARSWPRARLAYVTPSTQFPLGVTLGLERRLALLEWAEHARAWVVEDDYDSEYRYRGRPLTALYGLDDARRVIYVGSFSKVLFPGLRLGYVVAPPPLANALRAALRHTGHAAPMFVQAALARFVADGHLAAHIRRTRVMYAGRQRHFVAAVRAMLGTHLDLADSDAGMQVTCTLRRRADDEPIARRAAEHGIVAPALSRYYLGPRRGRGLFLGFAATPELQAREALAILARVM